MRRGRVAARGPRGGVLWPVRRSLLARVRHLPATQRLSSPRDVRVIRGIVAVLALLLGAYCLIAAATVLYAQTEPGRPNPAELAARERYQWPGWIPVAFLALVVLYAVVFAARRRGRARRRTSVPSTQDPPPITPPERSRHRDSSSR